jgi:hypothetical protein
MNKEKIRREQIYFDTARLLVGKTLSEDLYKRTLVITIRVNSLSQSDTFKEALYNRLRKLLYGKAKANHKDIFSMLIAADVEGSRRGAISHDTLLQPMDPHYHCIMVFSKSDWTRIEDNMLEWSSLIKKEIRKLREVKSDKLYIAAFNRHEVPDEHWVSPLMHFIEYCSKSSRVANLNDRLEYMPSIYPYDLMDNEKIRREQANIFKQFVGGVRV